MSGQPAGERARNLKPRYRKVFVMAPANVVTGGPEALHQLADAIRRHGGEAYIAYYPYGTHAQVPQAYRGYDVIQADPEDAPGNLVVFPETQPLMGRGFVHAATAMWWLSVDHFLHQRQRPAWDELRRHLNLAQSHYAAAFLAHNGVQTVSLTDYVNDDFHAPAAPARRRDAIAYNAKSAAEIEGLKRAAPELANLNWIEIAGMPRDEVRKLLSEAEVYADFGPHPGRDRMPREAALCGACVLTNRRGSAGHTEDLPLPGLYRLDHRDPGFASKVARTIRFVRAAHPVHAWRQRGYRRFAASGKATFLGEVRRVFFE